MGNGNQTGNQNQSGTQKKDDTAQQIQQGIKDLTSALAGALKTAGLSNSQLVQQVGTIAAACVAFAATAAASGGVLAIVGAAVAFAAAVVSSFQSSSGPDQFQQIQEALKTLSQEVIDAEKADAGNAIDQRCGNIQKTLAPAQSAQASLTAWANKPPTSDTVTSTLGGTTGIVTVLAALAPGGDGVGSGCPGIGGFPPLGAGIWQFPALYSVFWNDQDSPDLVWPPKPLAGSNVGNSLGYGKKAPPSDANGNVFNYSYVLPAFMYAASVFISVGAVIDPQFKQNWTESVLKSTVCFLQSVHEFIVSGLVYLTPGEWNGLMISSWANTGFTPNPSPPSFGEQYSFSAFGPLTKSSVFPVLINPSGGSNSLNVPVVGQLGGITIEYGVVEKYSGYSSVGLYTLTPPFSLQSADMAPYNKFQIRMQQRLKNVYVGTGLAALWNMINDLKKLTDEQPLPGPSIGVWSMRQVAGLQAGLPQSTPYSGAVSLRALSRFLEDTVPIDTPSGQAFIVSVRTVLEPRPHN
jgi:hypothetical protein